GPKSGPRKRAGAGGSARRGSAVARRAAARRRARTARRRRDHARLRGRKACHRTRVLGRSRRPVSESPPGRLAQGPLALVRAPDDQADNEEDNEEERAAPVEEDVEVARPALWSRLAGMAHHPAEVDNIGRQDEPTDPEPRAQ